MAKHIVVCMDGTWNDPTEHKQHQSFTSSFGSSKGATSGGWPRRGGTPPPSKVRAEPARLYVEGGRPRGGTRGLWAAPSGPGAAATGQ